MTPTQQEYADHIEQALKDGGEFGATLKDVAHGLAVWVDTTAKAISDRERDLMAVTKNLELGELRASLADAERQYADIKEQLLGALNLIAERAWDKGRDRSVQIARLAIVQSVALEARAKTKQEVLSACGCADALNFGEPQPDCSTCGGTGLVKRLNAPMQVTPPGPPEPPRPPRHRPVGYGCPSVPDDSEKT